MLYKVYFSDKATGDGFNGYLAHYGVKGMKWGVWNAETAARRNVALAAGIAAAGRTAIKTANPIRAAESMAITYAKTRVNQELSKAGRPLVDKLVKDPSKRDDAYKRLDDVVRATTYGAERAGKAFLTGSVYFPQVAAPYAAATFLASYASSRVSDVAVVKGKPVIDKMLANPSTRNIVYGASKFLLRNALEQGYDSMGKDIVGQLLDAKTRYDIGMEFPWQTPHYSGPKPQTDIPHYNGPKPHTHANSSQSTGEGIVSQLMNANVPDSLKPRR